MSDGIACYIRGCDKPAEVEIEKDGETIWVCADHLKFILFHKQKQSVDAAYAYYKTWKARHVVYWNPEKLMKAEKAEQAARAALRKLMEDGE